MLKCKHCNDNMYMEDYEEDYSTYSENWYCESCETVCYVTYSGDIHNPEYDWDLSDVPETVCKSCGHSQYAGLVDGCEKCEFDYSTYTRIK